MKLIAPIILLVGAVLMFIGVTQPVYDRTKELSATAALYDEALNKSKELRRVRDSAIDQYRSIPEKGLANLQKFLPDTVDNVRLVRDLDTLARNKGLLLEDIEAEVVGDGAAAGYGVLKVSFETRGDYGRFVGFLRDLEQSLRLLDIVGLSVQVDQANTFRYGVTVQTYWLKK